MKYVTYKLELNYGEHFIINYLTILYFVIMFG